MHLRDLGEFGLIKHIASLFPSHFPPGLEGIGNDCAVIPFRDHLSYLVTTDLLNENVHFIKSKTNPADLGYKSLAVNFSDIAAMGGKPQYAFLSLGLPPDTSLDWVNAFLTGFRQLTQETGVLLLGGDTTRAQQIVINILLIGLIETSHIKRRSQARTGDLICCTGNVGDSGAGLKVILEGLPQDDLAQSLVQAHVRPRPHLEEGIWLAEQAGVHAMMDLSDGIDSDIQRIMEESHCGAHIQVESLPLSSALRGVSQRCGWQAENLGLTGGEDYCLLVTIDPKEFLFLQQAYSHFFQRHLFQIGTILDTPILRYTLHGKSFTLQQSGFDHFK
jgi:thiamine-monophosphate kinase